MDFTENYEIKTTGEVISKKTRRPLSYHLDRKGYARVRLKRGGKGKTYLVHRLVAKQFLPNPENKPQINHKNGVKHDNRIENLEWVTCQENVKHSIDNNLIPRGQDRPNSKLSDDDVRDIRSHRESGMTYYEIALLFDISYQTAHKVCKRITYKHIL